MSLKDQIQSSMKNKLALVSLFVFGICFQSCYAQSEKQKSEQKNNPVYSRTDTTKVNQSDKDWKKILSPEVYDVARLKGTERPFTSKFETSKEIGTYYCAVCGNALFQSDTKFDSGCGWPSFYQPISKTSIIYESDNTLGMKRTEVMCGRCKGHLGHVFNDGPQPHGLRYCINSAALRFIPVAELAEAGYSAYLHLFPNR